MPEVGCNLYKADILEYFQTQNTIFLFESNYFFFIEDVTQNLGNLGWNFSSLLICFINT